MTLLYDHCKRQNSYYHRKNKRNNACAKVLLLEHLALAIVTMIELKHFSQRMRQ